MAGAEQIASICAEIFLFPSGKQRAFALNRRLELAELLLRLPALTSLLLWAWLHSAPLVPVFAVITKPVLVISVALGYVMDWKALGSPEPQQSRVLLSATVLGAPALEI